MKGSRREIREFMSVFRRGTMNRRCTKFMVVVDRWGRGEEFMVVVVVS